MGGMPEALRRSSWRALCDIMSVLRAGLGSSPILIIKNMAKWRNIPLKRHIIVSKAFYRPWRIFYHFNDKMALKCLVALHKAIYSFCIKKNCLWCFAIYSFHGGIIFKWIVAFRFCILHAFALVHGYVRFEVRFGIPGALARQVLRRTVQGVYALLFTWQ